MRYITRVTHLAVLCGLAASQQASALTELSDDSMSQVSGRDGITIEMSAPTLTADRIDWRVDNGGFDVNGDLSLSAAELALDATLSYGTISAQTVDLTGATLGAGNVQIYQTFDAGYDTVNDVPMFQFGMGINRTRLRAESLTVTSQPAVSGRSLGTWALDAPMSMTFANAGVFNMSYDEAYARGEIGRSDPNTGAVLEYGNLFYRQALGVANPYMTMHDFYALWEMPSGTLGIDGTDALVWRTGYGGDWDSIPGARTLTEADLINLALDFEYLYKDPGLHGEAQDFVVTSNDRGLMHFGWLGSIKDAEVRWSPGGAWYGSTAGPGGAVVGNIYDVDNKSSGLNFSATWDFVSRAEALALDASGRNEFVWRLGETSDVCPGGVCSGGNDKTRMNFELGDWVLWGTRTSETNLNGSYDYGNGLHTKPAASHFPLIALDAINGAGQGVGGVCWGFAYNGPGTFCSDNGSQFINVQPGSIGPAYPAGLQHLNAGGGTAGGLAIIMRDGQLQSFSRRIRLLERSADGLTTTNTDFNWGLIYALANVDASFYLYPGGSVDDNTKGVIADITLMSQTFDEDSPLEQGFNWEHGTHLLIADTDMDGDDITGETRDAQGIGFLSSSFLLLGNDVRVMIKNQTSTADYYSGGIDFASPGSRFNYRATFGGGVLPDDSGSYGNGPQIVQGAMIDLNLEGAVNLRFSPSTPAGTWSPDQYTGLYNSAQNYLAYSGAFRLGTLPSSMEGIGGNASGGGTYLSLAEPGRPDVQFSFANVNGDIAFTNGMIDIRGTNEDGDGTPKMVIANNMLIGAASATRINEGFPQIDLSSYSYGGTAGREFSANLVLGDNTLGTAVIPSARVYSSITLLPQ